MSLALKIALVLFALILSLIIGYLLSRGKIFIRYSLPWFLMSLIVIFVALFPKVLVFIQNILGFVSMVNMVIGMLFALIIYIIISLTVIISNQKKQITVLIQKVSMLESEKNKTIR